MDFNISYDQAGAKIEDVLKPQRNASIAIGTVLDALYGPTNTYVSGFACTPGTLLTVNVAKGSIITPGSIASTAMGALPSDNRTIQRQGSVLDVTNFPLVAPTTSGKSVNYLIQVAFSEVDTDSQLLSYRNAANPALPWSGPGNSGTAQPTSRKQQAILNAKRGTEANTGTQATPAADVGYVGLWVVTVAYGQTTVTAPNIVEAASVPWASKTFVVPSDLTNYITTVTANAIYLNLANVSTAATGLSVVRRDAAGGITGTTFYGTATLATLANTATFATNANNATYATNATFATNAGLASNATSAAYAVTAGSAGTATNATNSNLSTNSNQLGGMLPDANATPSTVAIRDAAGNLTANRFNGEASMSDWADLAERYEASEPLEIGDVVALGGSKEIRKATDNEVFGVVSEKPGFAMNEGAGDSDTHPYVAMVGRVPVKADGPISKFDYLVMSNTLAGVVYGLPTRPPAHMTVVGRALEDKEDFEVGLVLAVVKATL